MLLAPEPVQLPKRVFSSNLCFFVWYYYGTTVAVLRAACQFIDHYNYMSQFIKSDCLSTYRVAAYFPSHPEMFVICGQTLIRHP